MTEDQLRDIVRTNIRQYRDHRKWTQAEFAEKLDISINFLSDIENGKRWISPASMVKFASVLNIEPYELFKPDGALPPDLPVMLNKSFDEAVESVTQALNQVRGYYLSKAKKKKH